jgi:hypothetical protein
MIKVEIELNDIDYDSLIEQYLPLMLEKLRQSGNPASKLISGGMPASMAKMILRKLPQPLKEQLTADLINSNKNKIAELLQETARQNNVRLSIGDIKTKSGNI